MSSGYFDGWTGFVWEGERLLARWQMSPLLRVVGDVANVSDLERLKWRAEVIATDGRGLFSVRCSSRESAKLAVERFVRLEGGAIEESFPNWIRRKRMDLGLTKNALAKLVGLHHTTIADIENGGTPKSRSKELLESYLGSGPTTKSSSSGRTDQRVRALETRLAALETRLQLLEAK